MDVGHVCNLIIWEYKGRHRDAEQNPSTVNSYQESQGVDVEVGFGFAYDDMTILSSKRPLRVLKLPKGVDGQLARQTQEVRDAASFLAANDC
jgi:hypothetical protein